MWALQLAHATALDRGRAGERARRELVERLGQREQKTGDSEKSAKGEQPKLRVGWRKRAQCVRVLPPSVLTRQHGGPRRRTDYAQVRNVCAHRGVVVFRCRRMSHDQSAAARGDARQPPGAGVHWEGC